MTYLCSADLKRTEKSLVDSRKLSEPYVGWSRKGEAYTS